MRNIIWVLCAFLGVGCTVNSTTVRDDRPASDTEDHAPPATYTVTHGDGALQRGEECDDGNTQNGDGCSSIGTVEEGYLCKGPGVPCERTLSGAVRSIKDFCFLTDLQYVPFSLGAAAGRIDPSLSVKQSAGKRTLVGETAFGIEAVTSTGFYSEFCDRVGVEFLFRSTDPVSMGALRLLYFFGNERKRSFRWFVGADWFRFAADGGLAATNTNQTTRVLVHAQGVALPVGFQTPVPTLPIEFRLWASPYVAFPDGKDNVRTPVYPGVLIEAQFGLSLLEVLDAFQRLGGD